MKIINKRGWAAVLLLAALLLPVRVMAVADAEAIEVLLSAGTSQYILLNSDPCAKFDGDGRVQLPVSGKGVFVVKTEVSSFKIRK